MSRKERYDVVIVGGGHNGMTAAAYLAKCGLSVCLLEERPECGGAQENCELVAGVHIYSVNNKEWVSSPALSPILACPAVESIFPDSIDILPNKY